MTEHIAYAAFVNMQADLPAIGKDSTNPHFKNKYASNDAIIEKVRPVANRHGFAIYQTSAPSEDGNAIIVSSRLLHVTGIVFQADVFIPLTKKDAQGAAGALTYGRRYSLSALLCLATEDDDDGNAASRAPQARKAEKRYPPASQKFEALEERSGAAADMRVKGERLGDMDDDKLKKVLAWARHPDRRGKTAGADALAEAIGTVLADRALGEDSDTVVNRMKAAVDAEAGTLPFK